MIAGFAGAFVSLGAGCWLILAGRSVFGVILVCGGVALNTLLMASCVTVAPVAEQIRAAARRDRRRRRSS